MKYIFSKKDIEKAFSFAVKIHLDPRFKVELTSKKVLIDEE